MHENIKLATRKSPLALRQAHIVREFLLKNKVFSQIDIIPMSTSGDTVSTETFKKKGGKGLFLKELESALVNGKAQIAVHSMKDVPARIDKRFFVTSVMKREDPVDVFISRSHDSLKSISEGCIGSSSPRRKAIIQNLSQKVNVIEMRGNINTRILKLENEGIDGIILAKAGLCRMNMDNLITEQLCPETFVPAPGQGILCIECLGKNKKLVDKITKVVDKNTEICALAERMFAAEMNGDCLSPIGAYADIKNGLMTLRGFVASTDGTKYIKNKVVGDKEEYRELSARLSKVFIKMGSKGLLK